MDESKEHVSSLNQRLLDLEKNPEDISVLNDIFRSAHTLKGMAASMGFTDMADLTHHLENVLSNLKEGTLAVNTFIMDTLFQSLDRIQTMVDNIEAGQDPAMDISDLMTALDAIKNGSTDGAGAAAPAAKTAAAAPVDTLTPRIEFNQYDQTIFEEAQNSHKTIFWLRCAVDPTSLMNAVRAYMVFKLLEEYGEIIKSLPTVDELESGKFEGDFELAVITDISAEEIKEKVNNVTEITVVAIEPVTMTGDGSIVLESAALQAEPAAASTAAAPTTHPAAPAVPKPPTAKPKQTVRVDIDRLDKLMNLVGELVMHKGRLEQIGAMQKSAELNEAIEQIGRSSSDLQSVVMQLRMVPVEQVFNRFPRMVRDLAKELDKEISFVMEGKDTELDRTVIDEIGDPLVHLLRNSLDHGLEKTEDRVATGKNPVGTIYLRAKHEGNNVYIEVEDDGAGINVEGVRQKAIEKGMISDGMEFTMNDAIGFLFNSGFSTAKVITDVSGRGVGLDVVRTKIEALNGEINVDSKPGIGTKFQIKLPLTLAIIQALIVSVGGEIYAIPLSSVDETTMLNADHIKLVQNQEMMMMRGAVLPLYRLGEILNCPNPLSEEEPMYTVVVRRGDKQIGLIVDQLIGQQEIVIKSLGNLLTGISGIAGAIVAGDGNVRLIVDIATLI
jgi:two-component system chemotaxis sensor kinase CheA